MRLSGSRRAKMPNLSARVVQAPQKGCCFLTLWPGLSLGDSAEKGVCGEVLLSRPAVIGWLSSAVTVWELCSVKLA